MYLCVHKDLIGLQFLTDTLQRYFINRKFLTVRMLASTGYITVLYIFWEGDWGF
jgi:hypothetical protein